MGGYIPNISREGYRFGKTSFVTLVLSGKLIRDCDMEASAFHPKFKILDPFCMMLQKSHSFVTL